MRQSLKRLCLFCEKNNSSEKMAKNRHSGGGGKIDKMPKNMEYQDKASKTLSMRGLGAIV